MMNAAGAGADERGASVDRDCLLLAIEQSLRVRAHPHFFNWTQGVLQSLVPHDVLICALYDANGQVFASEILCPGPLAAAARETITRPYDGLLRQLVALWEQSGRTPMLIDPEGPGTGAAAGVNQMLKTLAFNNLAAHGCWGPTGALDTFFGFARVAVPLDARLAEAVEIVLPHLRAALIRIQPRKRSVDLASRARRLTGRETEILRLLQDGRSNGEIAVSLRISPLTVKNHVQHVLRKLGVRNRTQAVAVDLARLRGHDG